MSGMGLECMITQARKLTGNTTLNMFTTTAQTTARDKIFVFLYLPLYVWTQVFFFFIKLEIPREIQFQNSGFHAQGSRHHCTDNPHKPPHCRRDHSQGQMPKGEEKKKKKKRKKRPHRRRATGDPVHYDKHVENQPDKTLVPAVLPSDSPPAEVPLLLPKALVFPEPSPARAANNPVVHSHNTLNLVIMLQQGTPYQQYLHTTTILIWMAR